MAWQAQQIIESLDITDSSGVIPNIVSMDIDSRRIKAGDMFLAFRGAQVDGHAYLQAAQDKGAVLALVEELQDHPLPQICVANMRDALWQLAQYAREKQQNTTFIALTGSVGKTSTRSMLQMALSSQFRVYASSGNFNNDLGMPLCLAQMGTEQNWDMAVFELGMSAANEIAPLSQMLCPHIAAIVNVRPVHLENFDNIAGIAAAKAEVFSGLQTQGLAFAPSQAEFQHIFAEYLPNNAELRLFNDCTSFYWQDGRLKCEKQTYLTDDEGRLTRYQDNILLIAHICASIMPNYAPMLHELAHWQPESGRGLATKQRLKNGASVTIIDDSYNASLPSMIATLNDLKQRKANRKIAILGDMKELGSLSHDQHQQLINHLNQCAFDAVFLAGSIMSTMSDQVQNVQFVCEDSSGLVDPILSYAKSEDMLAFKGSRSVGLDMVIAKIITEKHK